MLADGRAWIEQYEAPRADLLAFVGHALTAATIADVLLSSGQIKGKHMLSGSYWIMGRDG